MMWESYIKNFEAYLKLEKSMSANSVEAYLNDLHKFIFYLEETDPSISPGKITADHLHRFFKGLYELGLGASSQSRILSGLRTFFKYLLLEDVISKNPVQLIEAPRLTRKLPEVLSVEEIEKIISSVDLSKDLAHRNKAIIEILYGCGLRVSELIDLRLSDLFFNDGFIRIIGKGDKQRLVPVGNNAIKAVHLYMDKERNHLTIHDEWRDIVFLNRRGKQLTRVMIFNIVKELARQAGIQKKVSPHTFRHSFASHLVDGGADLRAVQEMLGHQSILTTEIYTHLDSGYLRSTVMEFHPRA